MEKTGVEQILIDSAAGLRIGITSANKMFMRFQPRGGGGFTTITGTTGLTIGDSVTCHADEFWYFVPFISLQMELNGAATVSEGISYSTMILAGDAPPTKYLGAPGDRSAEANKEFRGPISKILLGQVSDIQGKYINTPTAINGTGLITTPIPISGNFNITFSTIRESDTSQGLRLLGSSANADNRLIFRGASHTNANDVVFTLGGTTVTWQGALAQIAPGEQYTVSISRSGVTVGLAINYISKGNNTLSTSGVFDKILTDYTGSNVYTNGIADLIISSAFGEVSYSLEKPTSGVEITNRNADSGTTYNGAWINAADVVWTFIPPNAREYKANEGAGQYLYDSLETGTTNKFTIQNYNALNWMPLGAVNYYVDPSAAASGSGYASTPFDDFTEINADNSIVAGGTIHIKRAQMVRGSLALSGVVGVHVQPYGTGTDPTINGSVIEAGTWAQDGTNGNAWYLAWSGAIGSIWVDNVLLTNKSTSAAMQSDSGSQWFDDSGNKMWVNAAVAPNSATIIEVVRAIDSVVSVVSSSGVHIRDIKAEKGADHGFSFSGSTVNSSLARCEANKVGGWRGDDSGFLLEGLSAGLLSTGINLTDCAASECQGDGLKSFKQLFMTVRNFAATSCGRGVTLWGETV